MEILIISGMSGAGKSRAAICLEDSGYYIVDNLPAEMMVKFAEFCAAAGGRSSWAARCLFQRASRASSGSCRQRAKLQCSPSRRASL